MEYLTPVKGCTLTVDSDFTLLDRPILPDRIIFIIPTYNESGNVSRLVHMLHEAVPTGDILIIDDNSPDGTGQIADGLSKAISRVSVEHRTGKLGLGSAYVLGLSRAITEGYEVAITLDCDFTHDPRLAPRLLEEFHRSDADVVIASRYAQGGGLQDWPFPRRAITRTAHFCTKMLLGLPFDATGGYRAYRVKALAQLGFDSIKADGYAWLFETLFRCHQRGLRIREIPVVMSLRQVGQSKISVTEILRSLSTLGRLFLARLRRTSSGS